MREIRGFLVCGQLLLWPEVENWFCRAKVACVWPLFSLSPSRVAGERSVWRDFHWKIFHLFRFRHRTKGFLTFAFILLEEMRAVLR